MIPRRLEGSWQRLWSQKVSSVSCWGYRRGIHERRPVHHRPSAPVRHDRRHRSDAGPHLDVHRRRARLAATVCVVVARCVALAAFLVVVTSPSQAYVGAGIQAAIPLISAIVSLPFMLAIGFDGLRFVT